MKRLAWLAPIALALALAGCISSTAGYDAARSAASDRGGVDLRWHEHEDVDVAAARRDAIARPLTEDAVVRLAVLANPSVQASLDRIGVARGALVSAVRLPNPELEGAAHFHDGDTSWDLAALIDVTDFFLLPLREAGASREVDAAALDAAGTALDVALEARLAFLDAQAAAQILELRRSIAFATSQSAAVAQKLREVGNTIELDFLNERALFEESRIAVARAEAEAAVARERVNQAVGLYGAEGAAWTIEGRLADPPAEELSTEGLERRALAASLELATLATRHAAAAAQADAARARGWTPEIGAGVSAEYDEGRWAFGPEVSIGVPLFYQGQGETAAAEAMMSVQARTHEATAIRVRASARQLATQLRLARERALFYKETLLPLRERILEQTQLQYNAMSIGVFQLLSAKRDQIEVARAYVETLREYWSVRAQLDQLARGRLPQGSVAMAADAQSSRGPADAH